MRTLLGLVSLAVLLAGCGADKQSGSSEVSSLQGREYQAGVNMTCGDVAGASLRARQASSGHSAHVCQRAFSVWLKVHRPGAESLALTGVSEPGFYSEDPSVAAARVSSPVTFESFRTFCAATQGMGLKSSLGFSTRQFAQLRSCTLDDIANILCQRAGAKCSQNASRTKKSQANRSRD